MRHSPAKVYTKTALTLQPHLQMPPCPLLCLHFTSPQCIKLIPLFLCFSAPGPPSSAGEASSEQMQLLHMGICP